MTPFEIPAQQLRLMQIFMPYALQCAMAVSSQNKRFVHYTSASAAMNILKTREVWMRKSNCMNDFREVRHGVECLVEVYNTTEIGKKFIQLMERLAPNMRVEIEELFNGWKQYLETDSYLTCFSEHESADDEYGRLSMWRAYSEGTGVALVMKNAAFLGGSDALAAYTSPVAYLDKEKFELEFKKVVDGIEAEFEFVHSLDKETIKTYIFHMLRFGVLCMKHPGFQEEREWRLIHLPTYEKSEYLIKSVEIIRGVPQPVYKVPLKDLPERQLIGIEIPNLLDHIIIGPTQFPGAMAEAFIELLADAGVTNPAAKITISNIPLRT